MTEQQAALVVNAIELVRGDVARGNIKTTELALKALSSLLPADVRGAVMKALGEPAIEDMSDQLNRLYEKIIIIK